MALEGSQQEELETQVARVVGLPGQSICNPTGPHEGHTKEVSLGDFPGLQALQHMPPLHLVPQHLAQPPEPADFGNKCLFLVL